MIFLSGCIAAEYTPFLISKQQTSVGTMTDNNTSSFPKLTQLYRSVYNGCLQYLNHRTIEIKYEDYYRKQDKEYNDDALEALKMQELNEIINNTLDSMPERCRKIFLLNRFEGLKYREIAEKLSLSVKTIEANMGKALKLFRRNLKNYVEA